MDRATNLDADPAPVDDVLSTDRRRRRSTASGCGSRATGEYDDAATVVVRYQTRDGQPGVDLVTPLRTDAGTAVLVDRGWLSTPTPARFPPTCPLPRPGPSTVTGWVRADATGLLDRGRGRLHPGDLQRRPSARPLDYPLYEGFVDAETEDPAPATELVQTELPDLGEGPHFFYGLQWWFFGLLAVFGFGYLAWDERRRMRRGPAPGKAAQESVSTP